MEKKELEQKKKIKSALTTSDTAALLEAVKMSRQYADAEIFQLILDALKNTDEPDVEAAIIQFMYDLKDESSIAVLIDAIKNEEMSYYHSFLIATFWQSALDGSEYLDLFVQKAIDGEYMSSLEALTVIENFDSSFPADQLMECIADLDVAIGEESEEEKKVLLQNLKEVVEKLPQEGE